MAGRRTRCTTEPPPTQDDEEREREAGVEEGEDGHEQQHRHDRIALGSGVEAFASGTGVRVHGKGGERVRAEARWDEPSVLFVRLIPNEQTEQFNTYGLSDMDVNARRTDDPDVGGQR